MDTLKNKRYRKKVTNQSLTHLMQFMTTSDDKKQFAKYMIELGRSKDQQDYFKKNEAKIVETSEVTGFNLKEQNEYQKYLPQEKELQEIFQNWKTIWEQDFQNDQHSETSLELDPIIPLTNVALGQNNLELVFWNSEQEKEEEVYCQKMNQSYWCFSPEPLEITDLQQGLEYFGNYFENIFKPFKLKNSTVTKNDFKIIRTLWPDEWDPKEMKKEYPIVCILNNPTELECFFYLAMNPIENKFVAYEAYFEDFE